MAKFNSKMFHEGVREADLRSSLCAHIQTKCEAVEIDHWIAYLSNKI